VLLGTGAGASLALVATPSDLLTTPYGRTLSLKLLLVGGVLALGAMNARVWTPRLDTDPGARALRRTAGVELLLGQLVLIVTAILVRTSPGP
jgi:putative copper resistance protein D